MSGEVNKKQGKKGRTEDLAGIADHDVIVVPISEADDIRRGAVSCAGLREF